MSGSRTISAAPTRSAWGATRSASPPGGWPLGRCCTPGGGWVSVCILIGSSVASAGRLFSASPYRPPDATWVTGRYGAATLTCNVSPAAPAAVAVRGVTAAATSKAAADWARRFIRHLPYGVGVGRERRVAPEPAWWTDAPGPPVIGHQADRRRARQTP